jgi:hypothetical protein
VEGITAKDDVSVCDGFTAKLEGAASRRFFPQTLILDGPKAYPKAEGPTSQSSPVFSRVQLLPCTVIEVGGTQFSYLLVSVVTSNRTATTTTNTSTMTTPPPSTAAADKLQILVGTANLGNAAPTAASLAAWIPPYGACASVTTATTTTPSSNASNNASNYFDIIVIGMQEATWKKKSAKSPKHSVSSTVSDDVEDEEEEEDSTHDSEVDGATMDTQAAKPTEAAALEEFQTLQRLLTDILGPAYALLVEKQRGQMRLYVFVRQPLVAQISHVRVACENTGIAHVLANKGGILASFTYMGSTCLAFASAHLAAHEGPTYYAARCAAVQEILRGCKDSTSSSSTRYDPSIRSHHLLFCGDLNFRTRFPADEPLLEHEQTVQKALALVEAQDYETLYSHDELQQGMAQGDVFTGFQTLPCPFAPTFKVERGEGIVYKTQRTPSYTDRVLWHSSDGLEASVTPWAYQSCPDFITSDHKPVRLACTLVPNSALPTRTIDKMHLIFTNLQGCNLPVMDVDGSSDPYLQFVLTPDLRATKEQPGRRGILGKGGKQVEWPQTKFVAKNLNPVWDQEIDIVLDAGVVGADAMLLLTAMDYDSTSKDDIMGTVPLQVLDLLSVGSADEMRTFDRPLLKYGKACGRLQFTLQVCPVDEMRPEDQQKKGVMRQAKSFLGMKKQQK